MLTETFVRVHQAVMKELEKAEALPVDSHHKYPLFFILLDVFSK